MKQRPASDLLQQICGWAITSLAVVFGLQSIRVFMPSLVGYLRDSQGMAALSLAPLALGVFGSSFLAALLRRAAGPRPTIWITAGGLGIARLAEQFSSSPSLDLGLSATGVVLFLLYIPNALGWARMERAASPTRLGLAFLLGVSIDTAIHIGGGTLDLSWQPGIVAPAITTLLAGALFVTVGLHRPLCEPHIPSDGGWRCAWGLVALGPWLFLQLLVYQNVARVSALTGWETPAAGAMVVAGNALGLGAAVWVQRQNWRPFATALASGGLLTVSLLIPEPAGLAAPLLLVPGQVLSAVLLVAILSAAGQDTSHSGLARTTVAHGSGQILFALITFLYYVTYDFTLGFRAPALLPVSALLVWIVTSATSRGQIELGTPNVMDLGPNSQPAGFKPAFVALALLAVPGVLALTWNRPQAVDPDPANRRVRVIDYNLHNGFNTDGRLDMEALAAIIEESGADVAGLQEVSRGWLIWGSLDMLTWLSQRLEMPYVSGPTADAQWGNAILSRYPILNSEAHRLPPTTVCILRGYIVAEIDVGGGTLTVTDTHFSHRGKNDAAREAQARTLASAWHGTPTSIILGDMNATPDSEAMLKLSSAGLVNVAAELGNPPILTSPATNPRRQIDYIWASPDLQFSDLEIVQAIASDHLPVIATITLP